MICRKLPLLAFFALLSYQSILSQDVVLSHMDIFKGVTNRRQIGAIIIEALERGRLDMAIRLFHPEAKVKESDLKKIAKVMSRHIPPRESEPPLYSYEDWGEKSPMEYSRVYYEITDSGTKRSITAIVSVTFPKHLESAKAADIEYKTAKELSSEELTSLSSMLGRFSMPPILRVIWEEGEIFEDTDCKLILQLKKDNFPDINRLKGLKKLQLQFRDSVEYTYEKVVQMQSLNYLALFGPKLDRFPKEFSSLKNLKQLVIHIGELKDSLSLSEFESLDSLEVYAPSLSPTESIGSLPNLKSFFLTTTTHLDSLPYKLTNCTSLESLNLKLPLNKNIIQQIVQFKRLKSLTLFSSLYELPSCFDSLANLGDLSLRNASLKPDWCKARLPSLKKLELYLYNSDLYFLAHMPKLEELEIENGSISDFQPLSQAKQLKRLTLIRANLRDFPTEILALENLEFLSLVGNDLIDLPDELRNLKSLKIVRVGGNYKMDIKKMKTKFPNLIIH